MSVEEVADANGFTIRKRKDGVREVHLPHHYFLHPYDYKVYQSYFMDQGSKTLIPSTEVYVDGELIYNVNSLGCKGWEVPDSRPVIGVFGDSVVQGIDTVSFVDYVNIGNAHALNGGVEGSYLEKTVDRAVSLSHQIRMACIAVHSGWHNLIYGNMTESHWRQQFDRIARAPVIAHFTLTADLYPTPAEANYAALFKPGHYEKWAGLAGWEASDIANFQFAMDRFNRFIRKYCRETGRLLIDLDDVIKPRSSSEVGKNFFDLIHPRAEVYPAIGAEIARVLEPHVAPYLTGDALEAPDTTSKRPGLAKGAKETGRNYSLW